jgi:hypothetical protein
MPNWSQVLSEIQACEGGLDRIRRKYLRELHVLTGRNLEDDPKLQDLVLTIHHSYMHTFASSAAIKIIENQNGNAIVSMAQTVK